MSLPRWCGSRSSSGAGLPHRRNRSLSACRTALPRPCRQRQPISAEQLAQPYRVGSVKGCNPLLEPITILTPSEPIISSADQPVPRGRQQAPERPCHAQTQRPAPTEKLATKFTPAIRFSSAGTATAHTVQLMDGGQERGPGRGQSPPSGR